MERIREIHVNTITDAVAQLYIESNYRLNADIGHSMKTALETETGEIPRQVMKILIENSEIAFSRDIPICQDTGMAVVFLEIGQDVHVVGGGLEEAVNHGVAKACGEGYLRASIVADPLRRKNTGNNTPAVVHATLVSGENIRLSVMPKGFGSENMSRLAMLPPSAGEKGVMDFVVETVRIAGPNPCPPVVIGVGVGGNMEKSCLLAKKALLRPIDKPHWDDYYARMEKELLERINELGIGPGGFGGAVTALGVNIEVFPTHIAGLPVAVNISCHATRHGEMVL